MGNLLAVPLLGQTAQVYGVGSLAVPAWVDVVVPLAMLGLAGVAALLIALRAGRMSARSGSKMGYSRTMLKPACCRPCMRSRFIGQNDFRLLQDDHLAA